MSLSVKVSGPFIDVRVTDQLNSQDITVLLQALDEAKEHGPFVLLTDTMRMSAAPRPVILEFVERLKQRPPMKDWLADAVVVNSPTARFVLSTLLMVAPLPTEVKAFDQRDEAERWLADVLRKARVEVPQAVPWAS